MPVTKISTAELEVGMFVSSLDRPWSETPFLFQGFPVRDAAEIEELKKLCRYVYIMVPDEEIELSIPSPRRKPEAALILGSGYAANVAAISAGDLR